jgi:NADPH-dependent ferric siderophore reductase
MATSEATPAGARRRPAPRIVEVRSVEWLTTHFVRVTVGSNAMAGFALAGPACHVKIFLPAPGDDEPNLPVWGPDGPSFPDDTARPTVRTYTPRRFHPATNELDLELVVHGEGPASAWASSAQPGDRLAVAGPGRHYEIDQACGHYLLAGDDTAIPAIGTLLEALPPTAAVTVVVETSHPDATPELASHPGADVSWFAQAGAPGDALAGALAALALDPGTRVWAACEAAAVRRIRHHLLDGQRLPVDQVVTRGYWKIGEENHPDGDYGQ